MRARCAWLLAAFAVGCLLPPLAATAGSASSPNTTGDSRASDSGGGFPIPLPIAPTCPWLADGVYSAALKNPLLGSLVKRTRLAAPMGPGSWLTQLNITQQDVTAEWAQRQFGWKGAIVVSATVRIDKKAASKWLPMNLLKVAKDTATVFIAWYPDSFCCGPYHEAAILLDIKHRGRPALHCPWMLVDSDRSMIAGREVLGFPKKMGQFRFTVTVPRTSSSDSLAAETFQISDPAFNATKLLEPGATVAAEVWRGGTKLVSISGRLDSRLDEAENEGKGGGGDGGDDARRPVTAQNVAIRTTIFPSERNVFVNIQTTHPMPPADLDQPDTMCLGNRPRLQQFIFDEVPTGNIWRLADTAVAINQTKTDAIGVPFGLKVGGKATPPFSPPTVSLNVFDVNVNRDGGDGWPLEVVEASFGVTNLFTGFEPTPVLGATVKSGYLEDNAVYWLRNQ